MEHRGIYVAFDGDNRHFAYARHPLDCDGFEKEQRLEIARLRRAAKKTDGRVALLSSEEYRRVVCAST